MGTEQRASDHAITTTEESPERREPEEANVALTRGQVNAVRAAFKAGITPSPIAGQFGISQAHGRKVLASEFRRGGKGRENFARQDTRLQNKRVDARLIAVGYRNICGGTCSFSPHAFPYESIRVLIAFSHR